ncbi:MAG: hypothetical protein M1531_10305 [Chloroflexi bacterium]|nr:hypothetical protein [Chloroflexota bacterium]
MTQLLIVTEAQSARRLMHLLRARRMSVSQLDDYYGQSFSPRVGLLVKVPAYRVQEAYETIASGG